MMQKLIVPFVALMLVSLTGCCSVFGVCASASVHTSIDSPQTFARQDKLVGSAQALDIAQSGARPTTCSD
jgi:hypothetical protein